MRHTDVLSVDVIFPSTPDGEFRPAPFNRRWPAVVFIQGGSVDTARYHWLGVALAQRGFVVAFPKHPQNLSIFEVDNASVARDLLAIPGEGSPLENLIDRDRIAVAGHSLGGVVAVKSALGGGYGAVALLASYPDSADALRFERTSLPTLLLAGASDCQAKLETVKEMSAGAVPGRNALVVLPGVTHYQFTDSDQPDRDRDCAPTASLETAHAQMVQVLEIFLRNALTEYGDTGLPELQAIEGLEVSVLEGGEE